MSYSGGYISGAVTHNKTNGDIQNALGVSSDDLGTLCTHPNINIFSRKKPCVVQGDDTPDDTTYEDNHYFVKAVATPSRNDLFSMNLAWTYDGAQAPYFRELDFQGYYNGAPVPFKQANGTSLLVDLVGGNAQAALFYMFMRTHSNPTNAIANKPFSTASGIATSGTAVSSTRLPNCMTVEDIGFYSETGGYKGIMGARLGLVIFDKTTGEFEAELFASSDHAVAYKSTRDNDMFIIQTSGLSLPIGTYTAVACARLLDLDSGNYFYLPVYNGDANYPARFDLEVGGLDRYEQDRVGLAPGSGAASATPVTSLLTVDNDIYVTMRVYNNSGKTMSLVVGNNPKFTLEAQVTGRVTDQTGTHDIGRTQVTANIVYPSSNLSINNGSYGDITFKITNVWSNDPSTQPTLITSGSATVAATLKYNGTTAFNQHGFPQILSLTYGS
jgi:hypothetical protein